MDPRFKRGGVGGGGVRPISILVHPSRLLSRGYFLLSRRGGFWRNSPRRSTCRRRKQIAVLYQEPKTTDTIKGKKKKKSGKNDDRKSIFPWINKWPAGVRADSLTASHLPAVTWWRPSWDSIRIFTFQGKSPRFFIKNTWWEMRFPTEN